MKKMIMSLCVLSSTAAMAGNLVVDDGAAAGAEVILREVASPKYFGKDALAAIKAALEGSYGSSLTADITSMQCEPSLGSKDCVIHLEVTDSSRPAGFQNLSFDVQVKIYQGKVLTAGPVQLED